NAHLPNQFGLYNMHGNVAEWCQDRYGEGYYQRSPKNDPPGPKTGKDRVQRGGGCYDNPFNCRSTSRGHDHKASKQVGFRVVCDVAGATFPAAAPAAAKKPGAEIVNGIDMRLCYIPAGKFLRGTPDGVKAANKDEQPQHAVTLRVPMSGGDIPW